MASLATLMYCITKSRLCPFTGTCESVQDMTQSPFDMKRRQNSLPSAAKGMRRFYDHSAPVMSPSLSMIRSCRSIPWLNIALRPPTLPLGLAPKPFLSDFRRPYSFYAGRSTYTGV